MPGFSIATEIGPIRDALARHSPSSELRELDYLDGHQLF